MNDNINDEILALEKELKIGEFIPKKRNIWIFDSETFTEQSEYYKKNGVVGIGLLYGEHIWSDENYKSVNVDDFINWIIKKTKKESIEIGFHNLKFDFSYLIKSVISTLTPTYNKKGGLKQGEFTEFTNAFGQNFKWKVKFHNCKYEATFVDTLKVLPESAENLAKFTPYEKFTDLDFHSLPEVQNFDDAPHEWKIRIINDVKIIKHMYIQLKSLPLPNGLTTASIAFKDLRRFIGKKWGDYYGCIRDYQTWKDFKTGYKGGAVLVNPKFKNKIVKLKPENEGVFIDIKSSYPNQCVNFAQPFGLPVDKTPDTLQLLNIKAFKVKLKPNKVAILQLESDKVGHKKDIIINSDDELSFQIWENEWNIILEAYDIDYIITKQYSFNADYSIAGWFLKMNKYKRYYELIGNTGMVKITKLLNNAPTGKFGENPYTGVKRYKIETEKELSEDEKSKYCNNPKHLTNQRIRFKINFGNETVHQCTDYELSEKFSYVPMISHITSGARIQLFQTINYKDNAKYFVYSDTDSILFTNANKIEIPPQYNIGDNLGNWSVELERINYINVIREKAYRVKGYKPNSNDISVKTRISGLKPSVAELIPDKDFKIGYKTTVLKNQTTVYGNKLVDVPFELKDTYRKRGI